jgi:hypothetical protein
VKLWIGPTLGFKRFKTAAITMAGIELLLRIDKGSSSTSVGYVFGADMRLLSGTPSWQRNKATTSHTHSHDFWLAMLFAPELR